MKKTIGYMKSEITFEKRDEIEDKIIENVKNEVEQMEEGLEKRICKRFIEEGIGFDSMHDDIPYDMEDMEGDERAVINMRDLENFIELNEVEYDRIKKEEEDNNNEEISLKELKSIFLEKIEQMDTSEFFKYVGEKTVIKEK